MLAVRSLFFALLVPGTVVGLIPYLIVTGGPKTAAAPWSAADLAFVPITVGVAILLWCIWDFAVTGRGTVAPVDPPTRLVRRGLYRYVRNPMYLGALVALLGEAALFRSIALLMYTAGWFAFINLVVLLYEEPALRRKFGASYESYCEAVGRWVPKRSSPARSETS